MLVEGVTDVCRLKTNAVAILGKDLSVAQTQLVARYFPNRPVVLFLDRGEDQGEQRRKSREAPHAQREDCARLS